MKLGVQMLEQKEIRFVLHEHMYNFPVTNASMTLYDYCLVFSCT